jgi:hypothetical protein
MRPKQSGRLPACIQEGTSTSPPVRPTRRGEPAARRASAAYDDPKSSLAFRQGPGLREMPGNHRITGVGRCRTAGGTISHPTAGTQKQRPIRLGLTPTPSRDRTVDHWSSCGPRGNSPHRNRRIISHRFIVLPCTANEQPKCLPVRQVRNRITFRGTLAVPDSFRNAVHDV